MAIPKETARPRGTDFAWRNAVRPMIYWLGATPAVWAFYLALTDQLGADPMKSLERLLGLWALRFLVIGLCVTPLRRLGGPNLLRYRRAFGLLAFAYAALHLSVYIGLDQGFDMAAVWKDIVKRPYITIGMAAFAILTPLAVTSNNAMIRRLGSLAWTRLHRLVYAAAALAAIHFVMVVKSWPPEPLIYAGLVAGLLLFRLFPERRKHRRVRDADSRARPGALPMSPDESLTPGADTRSGSDRMESPLPQMKSPRRWGSSAPQRKGWA